MYQSLDAPTDGACDKASPLAKPRSISKACWVALAALTACALALLASGWPVVESTGASVTSLARAGSSGVRLTATELRRV